MALRLSRPLTQGQQDRAQLRADALLEHLRTSTPDEAATWVANHTPNTDPVTRQVLMAFGRLLCVLAKDIHKRKD
jgi:hypothetical protein